MERNTLTQAKELKVGDRFYKAGSRSKKVCKLLQKTAFSIHAVQYPEGFAKTFNIWENVVFLRRTNEKREEVL